ncbi:hypothetical protein FQA47_015539 [Oryzias melastigma]|uniref:Uncharacterized protein n=1 Tax=Oryzias melastigma TaxID=30732 RepID=A0A834FQ80_ORYME|nr:hypothetical protein FQA47_015539 [Oryzias melastigma]
MASLPGSCQAVGSAQDENGDLDGSLQQMLKAIADERSRLSGRQELSGIGECRPVRSGSVAGLGLENRGLQRPQRGWSDPDGQVVSLSALGGPRRSAFVVQRFWF